MGVVCCEYAKESEKDADLSLAANGLKPEGPFENRTSSPSLLSPNSHRQAESPKRSSDFGRAQSALYRPIKSDEIDMKLALAIQQMIKSAE